MLRLDRSPPVLLALVTLAAATGCRDAGADRRTEIQRKITEVGDTLRLAVLTASDTDEARERLGEVVRELGRIDDADPGQQTAIALLNASAHCELAGFSMAAAQRIEASNRRSRGLVSSQIDAAMRLEAMAAGRAAISTTEQRADLDREREKAKRERILFSARADELIGPIGERRRLNDHDRAEVARLESEAGALRRQAREWGPADGLTTFQQALQLQREADAFELMVANRENDLRYDLVPEHEFAAQKVAYLQTMISEIGAAQDSLVAWDDIGAEQVSKTRQLIVSFREKIAEAMSEMDRNAIDVLDGHYESARKHLEKAVREAKRAAGGSGRGQDDGARLAVVRAREQQGRLEITRHRGLAAHATVLARLVASGGLLGNADGLRRALDDTRSARDEARDLAVKALRAARDELGQVRAKSTKSHVAALRASLDQSIAALTGEAVADPASDVARPRTGDSTPRSGPVSSGADDGGRGFASPEALLSALMPSTDEFDAAAAERILDAIHTRSETVRQVIRLQRQQLTVGLALISALKERFGNAALDQIPGAMGGGAGLASLRDARIQNQDERQATIAVTAFTGEETTIRLVAVDGDGWMIDGDSLFAGLDAAALNQIAAMTGVFQDITRRLRRGDFASMPEVAQALMQAIMKQAQRRGGGAGD